MPMITNQVICGVCGAAIDNFGAAVDNVVMCKFCGHNIVLPIVNKDGTVHFGSYPQSEVMGIALIAALTDKAGTLPTEGNARQWTSYKYYIERKVKDYMWYIDVEHNGEKYRGVYFTSYRQENTFVGSSSRRQQEKNGYHTGEVYWFKYEPIKWKILKAENGEALILADIILDSQQYYHDWKEERKIDGKTVYPNNYAHSDIRAWLNDNFYNAAFTAAQKELIKQTIVDNSASTTYSNYNSYTCDKTEDNVFLLSYRDMGNPSYGFKPYWNDDAAKLREATAYALCQGARTGNDNYKYKGNGCWWLRSPYPGDRIFASFVYSNGGVYGNENVYCTDVGVCPAMKIALDKNIVINHNL